VAVSASLLRRGGDGAGGAHVSEPDAVIRTFRYGYWPLFLLALPVCAKYLK
jgi:hypothetical protein